MPEIAHAGGHQTGFAQTSRSDRWWVGPLLTVLGLGAFFTYATIRAFSNAHYFTDPYLSPFYSPVLFVLGPGTVGHVPLSHAWFGEWPAWWPGFLPASPALLILVFPGAFRMTCYYYRKAYYRSFMGMPPGCGVGPVPLSKYRGETLLFLVQNLHRYALYAAICFIFILYYDAYLAFWKDGQFGFGVGTLVMIINPTLLGCYTFGCHSWRHLIAGRLNCFSCNGDGEISADTGNTRHKIWQRVSWLNHRHMLFAWVSLFWVGFTDVYVYLVSTGAIQDWNTWGH